MPTSALSTADQATSLSLSSSHNGGSTAPKWQQKLSRFVYLLENHYHALIGYVSEREPVKCASDRRPQKMNGTAGSRTSRIGVSPASFGGVTVALSTTSTSRVVQTNAVNPSSGCLAEVKKRPRPRPKSNSLARSSHLSRMKMCWTPGSRPVFGHSPSLAGPSRFVVIATPSLHVLIAASTD